MLPWWDNVAQYILDFDNYINGWFKTWYQTLIFLNAEHSVFVVSNAKNLTGFFKAAWSDASPSVDLLLNLKGSLSEESSVSCLHWENMSNILVNMLIFF